MEKNTLRLRFLGAIGTVTGSCTLMEYYCFSNNQKRYFLIDAGSFQNENTLHEDERKGVLKHLAKDIEMVFITHAHWDHIGFLPEIIKYGFKGKVCCTKATYELTKTMLTYGEGNESNNKLLEKITPFIIDGRRGEKQDNGFGRTYIRITDNFKYGYLRTSHILGSCAFYFQWTETDYPNEFPTEKKEWKYIYFTGDIGSVSDNVLTNIMFKGHQTPYWDNHEKCIVMESTYGGKVRQKDNLFQNKIKKLSEIVDEAVSRDGTIVIPAFALDRSQQILLDLYYIFKNKPRDMQLEDIENMDWKEILNYLCQDTSLDKLESRIKTLQGKEMRMTRKKLKWDIVSMCQRNKIVPEETNFGAIDDDLQEAIALLFNKYNIKKPNYNIIQELIGGINFTFDSPMIGEVNEVYLRHLTDESYSDKYDKRKFKYLAESFLKEFDISEGEVAEQKTGIKALLAQFLSKNSRRVKIIVSASGMCEEGKVIHLLEKYLLDENATIILTGFQSPSTNGFLLKNMANGKYDGNNEKERISLKLKNNDIRLADVKCTIHDMSEYYSAHADQEQLIDYITPDERNTGNITVLLNHGTDNAREELKNKIEERHSGMKVLLPEFNKWFNIVTLEYEPEDIEFKTNIQFGFAQVNDIHIYYPIGYDDEKLQSILDYISKL
jgi:Cft2 family RNA processing exonuclease